MTQQSVVYQLRIDPQLKNDAFAVFEELGINPSEAFRIFLRQVQLTRSIPFKLALPDTMQKEEGYDDWVVARVDAAIQKIEAGEMGINNLEKSRQLVQSGVSKRAFK